MFKRPNFHKYVMTRLVTIVVSIFLFITVLFLLLIEQSEHTLTHIVLTAISFALFTFAISKGALRMQHELSTINNYLANLESVNKIDYTVNFFTNELHEINQNLTRVLLEAKKREDLKQKYNAKLKLKNLQKSDMLSAIAHEFRNPISSIMGYSQTLQEDQDIPVEVRLKFLTKIHNNSSKIEELLERVLLWNKFENNEAKLQLETFDIAESINSVLNGLKDKYINRGVVTHKDSHIQVYADKTLLEIVLKNIIENSIKYSQDEVLVSIKNGRLFVKDSGIGISDDEIQKITKKFYRTNTNSWDNSMGLGLAMVKKILEMHHITLKIESKEGKGSTFSFKLPIKSIS